MTAAAHTPEPIFGLPLVAHGNNIYETTGHKRSVAVCVNDEEARRIVACVNACRGVTEEDLSKLIKIGTLGVGGVVHMAAKVNELYEQRDELAAALRESVVLIDDLLHQYAPEMCDAEKVKEAFARISDQGGTLYYIAITQKDNRAAIAQLGEAT